MQKNWFKETIGRISENTFHAIISSPDRFRVYILSEKSCASDQKLVFVLKYLSS